MFKVLKFESTAKLSMLPINLFAMWSCCGTIPNDSAAVLLSLHTCMHMLFRVHLNYVARWSVLLGELDLQVSCKDLLPFCLASRCKQLFSNESKISWGLNVDIGEPHRRISHCCRFIVRHIIRCWKVADNLEEKKVNVLCTAQGEAAPTRQGSARKYLMTSM